MITDVTPTKIYRLKNEGKDKLSSKNYNMIVIEDSNGELQHLLLSDSDVLKSMTRGRRNIEDTPQYRLRLYCGTTTYAFSVIASLGAGILMGYYLW